MRRVLLIATSMLLLGVASLFVFFDADPPPAPLVPAPANPEAAAELQAVIDDNYCGDAQQLLAQTSISVRNDIHLTFDSFVKSKPSADPLTTHQFLHYIPVDIRGTSQPFPAVVSCKLKTAERINNQYESANAGTDLPCRGLLERDVNAVLASLDEESLAFRSADMAFEDDEMANQGRTWLAPWPYRVVRAENGKLVWHSKALLVNYAWWIPLPERFIGTHYCHLPTPQYIQAVLTGETRTLLQPVNAAGQE